VSRIIYNVTVSVSSEIQDDWLSWMRRKHIPEVLETGCFSGYKLLKLTEGNQGPDPTFAIQYFCQSHEDLKRYRDSFSEGLQNKHNQEFAGKFVAFRTVLEDISC
jgi:Domain of unknown function (DUF4286)